MRHWTNEKKKRLKFFLITTPDLYYHLMLRSLLRVSVRRYSAEAVKDIHPLLLKRAENMEKEYGVMSGDFQGDQVKLSKLASVVEYYHKYKEDLSNVQSLKEIVEGDDAELVEEAKMELAGIVPELNKSIQQLQKRLLPARKYDDKPAILELRPGVGGSEAGLFTNDLKNMYINYANSKRWKWEIISENSSNGSVTEVILGIDNDQAYNLLRHESGVHRVQRIPSTESKGRVHTSTAAVVVLPKVSSGTEASLKDDERQFLPGEVRIDTMRAGGKGGQHVNTTDSAVRLVHIPTGIIVQQQDERSQPKNKAKAFSILRARLAALEREKQVMEQRKLRTDQVTTTDRSDKIRTYNYPQNRVTDHRCGYSIHDLEGCMNGSRLDDLIEKIEMHEFEERLQTLAAGGAG